MYVICAHKILYFYFFHIAESNPSLIRVGEFAESQVNRVFAESESDYTDETLSSAKGDVFGEGGA